jgi:hypothetical protein
MDDILASKHGKIIKVEIDMTGFNPACHIK